MFIHVKGVRLLRKIICSDSSPSGRLLRNTVCYQALIPQAPRACGLTLRPRHQLWHQLSIHPGRLVLPHADAYAFRRLHAIYSRRYPV